ncbi:MAG: PhzF family phenazine biosynthesis isomerase [Nakamurella sp.]
MSLPVVHRYAAFSATPVGGNPAGVVLAAEGMDDATMQRVAADIGYSETAFLTSRDTASGQIRVRYFSPVAEVAFCGHATIATGVALGEIEGLGRYLFMTNVGPIPLDVERGKNGDLTATFESPIAGVEDLDDEVLNRLLAALAWSRSDLEPHYPPLIGTVGNRHPILVASSVQRLADLTYDFEELRSLCSEQAWTTVQLVAPISAGRWRSRNPFPIGGVVEDPATGAAVAALGGYLRVRGDIGPGDRFIVEQGVEMGRPSAIHALAKERTILITGAASRIPS